MLVLGINTATSFTALTLIKKDGGYKTVFLRSWDSERDEAEKLLPQIKAALKKGTPDKIFVVTGPGAFTALRIGVTAANTLAYAFNAPVVSCSTYEFLAASLPEKLKKKTAILLRAGGEFVAVKLPQSKKVARIGRKELEKFFASHNKKIEFAVSDMSAEEKKKCVLPGKIKWVAGKTMKPFDEVVAEFAGGKKAAKKQVAPRYLLPPKITVSKKEIFT